MNMLDSLKITFMDLKIAQSKVSWVTRTCNALLRDLPFVRRKTLVKVMSEFYT